MEHCLSCKSGTECIKCEEGFDLNNNKCSDDDEEKKGLSKGAVAGIVIAVVLFLLILGLIAYFVYKKMSKKYKTLRCVTDSNNRYDINEIKKEKEENKNIHSDDNMRDNVVVHKRRSVHNIKWNNWIKYILILITILNKKYYIFIYLFIIILIRWN